MCIKDQSDKDSIYNRWNIWQLFQFEIHNNINLKYDNLMGEGFQRQPIAPFYFRWYVDVEVLILFVGELKYKAMLATEA